jgi:uncharacterized protein (DUF952 family)
MKTDLIFYVVSRRKWPQMTRNGQFIPEEFEEDGTVTCILPERLNGHLNEKFKGRRNLYILVIDTTRLEYPPKERDGYAVLSRPVNVDAILDKIQIDSPREGDFDLQVDVS